MPRFVFYTIVLIGVCAYAFWRGRSDERLTAAVCLIASFASLALLGPDRLRYSGVELGVLLVDLSTFAAFTYVAVRSERFWPLWISGLQLTTSFGHVLKAIDANIVPFAYGAALRVWSYPILFILAVAVWRGQRRMALNPDQAATR